MDAVGNNFKITFRTSSSEMFDLTIPNAFNFEPDSQTHIARINNAANNIKNANAIDTGGRGDITGIESIRYGFDDILVFNVAP